MNHSKLYFLTFFASMLWLLTAAGCSENDPTSSVVNGTDPDDTSTDGDADSDSDGDSDADGDADGDSDADGDTDTGSPVICIVPDDEPLPEGCDIRQSPACGDGILNQDYEVCDDGNTLPGDGANGRCAIEPNYICDTDAEPCTCVSAVICGNGTIEPGEVCDDNNTDDGDGCNATCDMQAEGYVCPEGELCIPLYACGNGRVEKGEQCEDGGDPPVSGDGCDADCMVESGYECLIPNQPCTRIPYCGDGSTRYDLGEVCDDGNTTSNDGCDAGCQTIEEGYECPPEGGACTLIPTECGDGVLDWDEECDDNNTKDNDGCSADCQNIENGYTCPYQGAPCLPDCGDGVTTASEACDDGNEINDDGCTNDCEWEDGKTCKYIKPAGSDTYECIIHECGDGELGSLWRTTIACDDGNMEVGDGCSPLCQKEPICTPGAGCTSECGDGLVIGNEECDDGNNRNGDGCAEDCTVEPGYACDDQADALGDSMDVLAVYRDFTQGDLNGDFESTALINCNIISPNMVEDLLDATTGKPVFNSSYGNPTVSGLYNGESHTNPDECDKVSSATTFAQWYDHMTTANDGDDIIVQTMTLWRNDSGDYVNTWLDDGTRWQLQNPLPTEGETWCSGDIATTEAECIAMCTAQIPAFDATDDRWECRFPCSYGNNTCAFLNDTGGPIDPNDYFDGNPVFFPIDGMGISAGDGEGLGIAMIPDPVYLGGWKEEETYMDDNSITPPAGYSFEHNFLFTSEIRFWFQYDSTATQTLNFVGDDDVWVFVNGRIALDLGGIHIPVEDEFTLQDLETSHGLQNGYVYEIVIFQAERMRDGSSYRLTVGGFNTKASECHPDCGDGVITIGEQCDNGDENADSAYNGCTTTCELGPRCGDGIVNGEEDCDNGVNNDLYGYESADSCAKNCVFPPYCGDDVLQPQYGEQCDDGIDNTGEYNACNDDCTLGPFCGDG
ncbi:MAG: DUF4215 domain-containing protein, partial [Deltaproteobacteria bacterium]|nr:DUF4215 domain-containing protein [Deltaproteobacteria bacterium]